MNNLELVTNVDPVLGLDTTSPGRSVAVIVVHVTVNLPFLTVNRPLLDHGAFVDEFVDHMPNRGHNYYPIRECVGLDEIIGRVVGNLAGIITLTTIFTVNTPHFSEPEIARSCSWGCMFRNSVVGTVAGIVFGIVLGQVDIVILALIFNTCRRAPRAHTCSWIRFFGSCVVGVVVGIVVGIVFGIVLGY